MCDIPGTHIGKVCSYPGLSNIMFENRLTN